MASSTDSRTSPFRINTTKQSGIVSAPFYIDTTPIRGTSAGYPMGHQVNKARTRANHEDDDLIETDIQDHLDMLRTLGISFDILPQDNTLIEERADLTTAAINFMLRCNELRTKKGWEFAPTKQIRADLQPVVDNILRYLKNVSEMYMVLKVEEGEEMESPQQQGPRVREVRKKLKAGLRVVLGEEGMRLDDQFQQGHRIKREDTSKMGSSVGSEGAYSMGSQATM